MASLYSGRGRGRGGIRNVPQHSRPGLLGEAPGNMRPDLLDSLSAQSNQYHTHQQYETPPRESRPPPMKRGLLGSAPPYARQKGREPPRERQQSYSESREFSYNSQNEYEGSAEEGELSHAYTANISSEVKQLISNLGLSKSDLEQLSDLPERELTANNFARVIRDLRNTKAQQQNEREIEEGFNSLPDRREISYRPKPVRQRSFSDHYEDDQSKEYEDGYNEEEEEDNGENEHIDDAFTSFQEKWYSDGGAKDKADPRNRNGMQGQSSILRGSRGPASKSSRWEKEDQQQQPPHSKVNKQTPKPTGLLGSPLNPSTQELDLLAATISSNRAKARKPADRFQQERNYQNQRNQRSNEYPEQERYVKHEPPPAQQANAQVAMSQAMLEAQMKAMQVLQSEALQKQYALQGVRGLPGRSNYEDGKAAAVAQARKAAADMRLAQGRVVYIRYKSPIPSVLTEADLVDLASAFDKVTNILLVKPKSMSLWHQAFLELHQSDGAAAMLEHYMIRPPTCKGILVQVQKSNYKTLKLREHQMERDIDELVRKQKNDLKRHRSFSISPVRNKKSGAPDTNRSRRSPDKRRSNSSTRRDNERDHKKTDRRKRSRSKESTKRRIHSSSPDPKASKSSQNRKHSEKKKISPSKTERTSKSSPAKSDKISKVETKKPDSKEKEVKKIEEKRSQKNPEEKSKSETKELKADNIVLKQEIKDPEPTPTVEKEVDKEEDEAEAFTIVDSTEHNDSDDQENNGICDAKEDGAKAVTDEDGAKEQNKDSGEDGTKAVAVEDRAKDQNEDAVVHTEENSHDGDAKKVDRNTERKNQALENITELTSMSEALLMIVQKNSAKAVVLDMMSIISKTVEILKEIDV